MNTLVLELIRLGEQIAKKEVDKEGRDHAEPGDNDSHDDRSYTHRSRAPTVPVSDAAADAHNPTVPLRSLYTPHI